MSSVLTAFEHLWQSKQMLENYNTWYVCDFWSWMRCADISVVNLIDYVFRICNACGRPWILRHYIYWEGQSVPLIFFFLRNGLCFDKVAGVYIVIAELFISLPSPYPPSLFSFVFRQFSWLFKMCFSLVSGFWKATESSSFLKEAISNSLQGCWCWSIRDHEEVCTERLQNTQVIVLNTF